MFLGILTFLSVSFGHHSSEDFPVHSRACSLSTSAYHNKLEHITQVLKTLRRPLLLQHQVPALPGRPGPSSGHQRSASMPSTVQLKTGDSPNLLTPTGLRPLLKPQLQRMALSTHPYSPLANSSHLSEAPGSPTPLKRDIYPLRSHLSSAIIGVTSTAFEKCQQASIRQMNLFLPSITEVKHSTIIVKK